MNCLEITRILDDGDIAGMTERERGEVETHLFTCRDCAADWNIHQRLMTGFAPPVPAGLRERARALVVASAARPARSRAILFGAILVMAAAAAMLGLWLREPAASTVIVEATEQVQPAAASAVDATPSVRPQADAPAATEEIPTAPPPGSFTVRVRPLKSEINSAEGNALAQKFRDRVIEELSRIPNLVLVDPKSADVQAAQFEVRMTLNGTATLFVAEVDATTSAAFAASDAVGDELAKLSPPEQSARRYALETEGKLRGTISRNRRSSFNLQQLLGSEFPRTATLSTLLPANAPAPPQDPLEFAVNMLVRDLRVKVFPVSAAFEQELLAWVRDSGRKFGDRMRAFGGLLSIAERRGGLSKVDAAVIHAVADFAISAPATYNQLSSRELDVLWEGLAATKHPDLVLHLIHALDVAPTASRLQIVKILAKDFGDDPRTLQALEAVSQRNSEAVVRMAALRESRDESKWRDYVVAALNDTNLADIQRLQPIADMVPDSAALTAGNVRSKVQLDDRAIRELGILIMKVGKDYRTADIARNSLTVLATMESPTARDFIVDLLRSTSNATFTLRGAAMTLSYQQYPNDPQVRTALEEIASSSAADSFMAKSALEIMDMKARTGKNGQQQAQPPQ